MARDEARADNDVDILVEFQETPTLAQYMSLKFYLEGLLEKEVDLGEWEMLKPRVRANIEKDIIPIESDSSA